MQRIGPLACPICRGRECWGGGNKGCIQRDPRPSHVAGILDTYGGLRTIVAHKASFKHHKREDEILVVVPNLLVHEPIAWGDIPFVIERARLAICRWIENARPNEPWQQECIAMFRLRELEYAGSKSALNFEHIAQT